MGVSTLGEARTELGCRSGPHEGPLWFYSLDWHTHKALFEQDFFNFTNSYYVHASLSTDDSSIVTLCDDFVVVVCPKVDNHKLTHTPRHCIHRMLRTIYLPFSLFVFLIVCS